MNFSMYILKKRNISDVLFLLCQIPRFMGNNKSSIKIEDLEDQKLSAHTTEESIKTSLLICKMHQKILQTV